VDIAQTHIETGIFPLRQLPVLISESLGLSRNPMEKVIRQGPVISLWST